MAPIKLMLPRLQSSLMFLEVLQGETERKLKVVNQCEKMLANIRGCNEGDYNSGYC